VIGRYKMGKHFILTIGEGLFPISAMKSRLARKRRWMGFMWFGPVSRRIVYVPKTPFVLIRPWAGGAGVPKFEGNRFVNPSDLAPYGESCSAHIFLCLLAYYVEWYLRKALAPLLFGDEELDGNRKVRDPVKPAKPSFRRQRRNRVASRQKVLWFRVSIRSLRNWQLVAEAAVVFRPTLKAEFLSSDRNESDSKPGIPASGLVAM